MHCVTIGGTNSEHWLPTRMSQSTMVEVNMIVIWGSGTSPPMMPALP